MTTFSSVRAQQAPPRDSFPPWTCAGKRDCGCAEGIWTGPGREGKWKWKGYASKEGTADMHAGSQPDGCYLRFATFPCRILHTLASLTPLIEQWTRSSLLPVSYHCNAPNGLESSLPFPPDRQMWCCSPPAWVVFKKKWKIEEKTSSDRYRLTAGMNSEEAGWAQEQSSPALSIGKGSRTRAPLTWWAARLAARPCAGWTWSGSGRRGGPLPTPEAVHGRGAGKGGQEVMTGWSTHAS